MGRDSAGAGPPIKDSPPDAGPAGYQGNREQSVRHGQTGKPQAGSGVVILDKSRRTVQAGEASG